MAGSKREFAYETDTGLIFNIEADESNTETVNGSLVSTELNPVLGQVIVPVVRRLRSARYVSGDGNVVRVVPLLRPSVVTAVPPTIAVNVGTGATAGAQVVLFLAKTYAEKLRRARGSDTGLNDGD